MILSIEGATDHSCLINRSGAEYKVFTSYCCNYSSNSLITKSVVPLSTSSSTVHSNYPYARIYELIVEEFAFEIRHGRRFHFFSNFSFDTVVIHFVPATFHFLTEPGIVCCVRYYVLNCFAMNALIEYISSARTFINILMLTWTLQPLLKYTKRI